MVKNLLAMWETSVQSLGKENSYLLQYSSRENSMDRGVWQASLSHSVVFLCFFALIAEERFLISPCYFLELCIQMGISFLFSFTFHFSSFHSYLYGLPRQPFCFFAFLFHGDGLDPCLLYNVTNLRP